MKFTVTEVYGSKPISNWIAIKLTEFVKQKYGLDIQVTVNTNTAEKSSQLESAQNQLSQS
ncbi:hypothetical protein AWM70_04755 [Paenibacillus yonginensis]|uniref:Uncharacterized protein n=1 Tax=Paenibacillus yonginensis TaxID=1462996 RepID=A0A1B1MXR4_9BACL|nr:hypothetical protein [Paenibacillus yonginensis]ANS73964.1 hypothetical protein AWM70_04755 [Paenibacillus yonginensis]